MKRLTGLLLGSLLLGGCFDDVSDIKAFMAKVDRETPRSIAPIPEVRQFAHIKYVGAQIRDPFSSPKAEGVIDKANPALDCLQPDRKREKQALEKYALSNLKMKGTMGYEDDPWALIEATSDGSLHRVSVGHYMGLAHGRITKVMNDQVQLVEMVPDGTGCWQERSIIVDMSKATASSENK